MNEKCEYCGSVEEVEFTEDPFALEINGDETKHWLCGECVYQCAMDI